MQRMRMFGNAVRALFATALATTTAGAIAGDATFFSHRDFTGQAMTVRGPAPKLEQIGFNDTASSLVIRQGVWEVCTEAFFRGRCKELQPGEYSSLGVSPSDRIASAREIGASAQPVVVSPAQPVIVSPAQPVIVSPAPAVAPPAGLPLVTGGSDVPRIVLYENTRFQGQSIELSHGVDDLDRVRFGDRADSAIVVNGVWRLCEIRGGRGDCVEIGPGRYDSLGGLTNRVGSAELLSSGAAAVQPPVSGGSYFGRR